MLNRKSDLPRHAKRYASDEEYVSFLSWLAFIFLGLMCIFASKPRYTVEGYNYKTWQQSNVYTHIWRQYVVFFLYYFLLYIFLFITLTSSSVFFPRKRLHGNSSTGPKNNKPKKIVPVRVLRGVEAESPDPVNAVASQFSKLSFAEASTSAQCYAWCTHRYQVQVRYP